MNVNNARIALTEKRNKPQVSYMLIEAVVFVAIAGSLVRFFS